MVKTEISSSETDTSAGEERKSHGLKTNRNVVIHRNLPKRKSRSTWSTSRFWRSNRSNSSTQGSASDHEMDSIDVSSIDQPEPSSGVRKINSHLRLPSRSVGPSSIKTSSAESLINIIRNFSNSHRSPPTPSSPQISDHEPSSAYPTPISTPGSPGGSLETISPSSLNSDNTIQVSDITFFNDVFVPLPKTLS